MIKIMPILLGVVVSYAVAAALGEVDFSGVADAPWVGLPIVWDNTVFCTLRARSSIAVLPSTAIITIMPLALATMIEHIGDMSAIGSTCERNYIADPGLHRTLLGDGLGHDPGFALRRSGQHYVRREHRRARPDARVRPARHPHCRVLRHRASRSAPKFAAVIAAMPACVIGGVSLVLYGMISGCGRPQPRGEPGRLP